jgi:hypothetical protein
MSATHNNTDNTNTDLAAQAQQVHPLQPQPRPTSSVYSSVYTIPSYYGFDSEQPGLLDGHASSTTKPDPAHENEREQHISAVDAISVEDVITVEAAVSSMQSDLLAKYKRRQELNSQLQAARGHAQAAREAFYEVKTREYILDHRPDNHHLEDLATAATTTTAPLQDKTREEHHDAESAYNSLSKSLQEVTAELEELIRVFLRLLQKQGEIISQQAAGEISLADKVAALARGADDKELEDIRRRLDDAQERQRQRQQQQQPTTSIVSRVQQVLVTAGDDEVEAVGREVERIVRERRSRRMTAPQQQQQQDSSSNGSGSFSFFGSFSTTKKKTNTFPREKVIRGDETEGRRRPSLGRILQERGGGRLRDTNNTRQPLELKTVPPPPSATALLPPWMTRDAAGAGAGAGAVGGTAGGAAGGEYIPEGWI